MLIYKFVDRLYFFLLSLISMFLTLVSFDMGSNYVFNSDRECKYSRILFWISSIHAVHKYKFIIVLRFSSNQAYTCTRNDHTLYSNKPYISLLLYVLF